MSDIERKLLSKMTDIDEISRVYDLGLRQDVFEDSVNMFVFVFMMDYWQQSKMKSAPTRLVMEEEYPQVPLDDEVEETTDWLVDHLKRRYSTNRAQDILRRAAKASVTDPVGALNTMWQEAYAAAQINTVNTTYSDMSKNVQERRDLYLQEIQNQTVRGVPFGLTEVDEHTRGIIPGELAAVAAFTKVGKSWLLANAFVNAVRNGYRPTFFTLEMNIKEMEKRIDCLYSGVSYAKYMEHNLNIEEMGRLRAGQDELATMDLVPLLRPDRGDRTVRLMTTRARQLGTDLILVDQLSWIDAEKDYTGDSAMRMKHGELIYDLKEDISSGSQGKMAGLIAVQMNRQVVRSDNGGRGALENFANSSMIEQTVDIGLGLWRSEEMRQNNSMGLDIMGSRRCDKQSWTLGWNLSDLTEITVRGLYQE